MYLLYLDESGDPNGWHDQNHFALGGVAVYEGQIYNLTKQMNGIQASFFPDISVPIAFHTTDVRQGKGRFRKISKKERQRILDEICQLIASTRFPNLILFATAMHISAVKDHEQVLHDTFQDICQRFNTLLMRQYKLGYPEKGLLIIDRAHQDRYRTLLANFQRSGTDYGYLGNVVDIPYFASRHDTRMLQLADFCAHSVFRYYERGDANYFNKILPRFDRRMPRAPPDGLKHITKKDCSCEACSWR